jgi:hypothetical protein
MESIEGSILKRILKTKKGDLIFPDDFNELGSSEAIRVSLHRLEKKEKITRVAQGIYVRPKESKLIGRVMPTTEEIALGIANRDRIRIVPTGAYAMNALGLSTQVPTKVVFLSDGSPRLIKMGRRTIKFKKASPKNLLAKGKISSLVIQALRSIGTNLQTEEEEAKILKILKMEDPKLLLHDIKLAPVWIQKIMKKALKK